MFGVVGGEAPAGLDAHPVGGVGAAVCLGWGLPGGGVLVAFGAVGNRRVRRISKDSAREPGAVLPYQAEPGMGSFGDLRDPCGWRLCRPGTECEEDGSLPVTAAAGVLASATADTSRMCSKVT